MGAQATGGNGRRAAFIGVGRMGGRMARRLLDAGTELHVYDPEAAATAALAEQGATVADSPAAAAAEADFVFCSLPGPAQLEAAIAGTDGVLASARAGTVVIDFTTGEPETSRSLAGRCAESGLRFLDAPVSRGLAAAENGTLAMMVGGEAADLEAARPLLDPLASEVLHVGPVGAGQIAKLCNNMLGAVHAAALGEILVAGVRAGIGLDELTAAIRSSSGTSFILEHYLPVSLFTDERPTTFALSLMRKDIGLFMGLGSEAGATLPLSGLVQQIFAAASAEGLDGADLTSVAEIYESLAGVRLRLPPPSEEGS